MEIKNLVSELKQNNEDFEFYPTTDKMLDVVIRDMSHRDSNKRKGILDIGAGSCKLFKRICEFNSTNRALQREGRVTEKYFAIEKSKILISKMPSEAIVLSNDFYNTTFIDKSAQFYFCNPPYSDFENWTIKLLSEGNFDYMYLVIPERWKNNERIMKIVEERYYHNILYSSDFLDAERQARAKVDIVLFSPILKTSSFDIWFEETFKVDTDKKSKTEYEREEEQKAEINKLVVQQENKVEALVNLYNEDMQKVNRSFSLLCSIDESILQEVGVDFAKVKESLKQKISSLKIIYWRMVFDYLDEVTSRLTYESREKLFNRFKEGNSIDFNYDNIENVLIWIIKNANSYYSEQLISFYKKLTSAQNVKPYKSNQKVFEKDDWRFRNSEHSHYVLDYRLIVDRLFTVNSYYSDYYGDWNKSGYEKTLQDIVVLAKNLGFKVSHYEMMEEFGKKYYIYLDNQEPLLEYKHYQNGNTHLKFNIEFAKALNVEVSRLLGWIRTKEDIAKEFPDNIAKGAEKYFNSNMNFRLTNNNIKLLA